MILDRLKILVFQVVDRASSSLDKEDDASLDLAKDSESELTKPTKNTRSVNSVSKALLRMIQREKVSNS